MIAIRRVADLHKSVALFGRGSELGASSEAILAALPAGAEHYSVVIEAETENLATARTVFAALAAAGEGRVVRESRHDGVRGLKLPWTPRMSTSPCVLMSV